MKDALTATGVAALRVGFLGTRHVHATGYAHTLRQLGCEIVAAVEADTSAAGEWRSASYELSLTTEELFERCDALVVAGTNVERTPHTLEAARAGLPVLTEKPLAVDRDELELLQQGASDAALMVALPLRFSLALQAAKRTIDAGGIGTPLAARGTNHGQYPGGWFGDRTLAGGGAVMDHTIHVTDALCWLMSDRVERVYAEAASLMHELPVEDCGVLTLEFESGLFASLDASWSRPASFHTWGDAWIEVVGSEGRLIVDPLARHLNLYDDQQAKLVTTPYGDDMNRTMLEAFVAFATSGGDAPVTLAEGAHGTQVTLAALQSARISQPVDVQP